MNWLGALLTVISSYFCGSVIAKGETERLNAIDSLLRLLTFMRLRMLCERMPLFKIFSEFDDGFLDSRGFLKLVRSSRSGLNVFWRNALSTLPLDKDVRDELLRFGETLGGLTLDEQISRIDALISFLTERQSALKGALRQRKRSIRSVCLLMGIALAIILL